MLFEGSAGITFYAVRLICFKKTRDSEKPITTDLILQKTLISFSSRLSQCTLRRKKCKSLGRRETIISFPQFHLLNDASVFIVSQRWQFFFIFIYFFIFIFSFNFF